MLPAPNLDTSWIPVRMPEKSKRTNLVILRTGNCSLHTQWERNTPRGERSWDLLLSHYGKNEPDDPDADIIVRQGAFKYSACHRLFQDITWLGEYRAVWFCDDDIMTNWADIDRMFALFHAYDLLLAQPTLTANSYGFWPECFQRPDMLMRFTNFVEIMVPLFSARALQTCLPSFAGKITGHGLDYLWPELLGAPRTKICLIDAIAVHHTRPGGGGSIYDEARQINVHPKDEHDAIIREYRLSTDHLEYGAITAEPRNTVRATQKPSPHPLLGDRLIEFFKTSIKPSQAEAWRSCPQVWQAAEEWSGGDAKSFDLPPLTARDAFLGFSFSITLQHASGQPDIIRLDKKGGQPCVTVKIMMVSEKIYHLIFTIRSEGSPSPSLVSPPLAAGEAIHAAFQIMPGIGWASLRINANDPLEAVLPAMPLGEADFVALGNDDVKASIKNLRVTPFFA